MVVLIFPFLFLGGGLGPQPSPSGYAYAPPASRPMLPLAITAAATGATCSTNVSGDRLNAKMTPNHNGHGNWNDNATQNDRWLLVGGQCWMAFSAHSSGPVSVATPAFPLCLIRRRIFLVDLRYFEADGNNLTSGVPVRSLHCKVVSVPGAAAIDGWNTLYGCSNCCRLSPECIPVTILT